jgi:hypothetical protein
MADGSGASEVEAAVSSELGAVGVGPGFADMFSPAVLVAGSGVPEGVTLAVGVADRVPGTLELDAPGGGTFVGSTEFELSVSASFSPLQAVVALKLASALAAAKVHIFKRRGRTKASSNRMAA